MSSSPAHDADLNFPPENGHPEEFKKKPVSLLGRFFNIAPSQWGRVSECWGIVLFFKIGSAIGWTVLIAAFVSHFGISFLPTLFALNAVLIVISTLVFEQLIVRMKREVLMILMILLAAICLFFAALLYDRAPMAFFGLVIFAESFFLAQFNVLIPILVADRFTPLESQKTFSFIESGDTIGGMIGAATVGVFAGYFFPTNWFLYIWILSLACVLAVFLAASVMRPHHSILPIMRPAAHVKTTDQIKRVLGSIERMPFLKGLIVIVLFQWIFMNVLEFQYTKAVEQSVTKRQEQTLAVHQPKLFQAAVLSSSEGVHNLPEAIKANAVERELSVTEQALLTEKLGKVKGIFHAAALIVQILIASRLITSLGVVGSMVLHPVVMLISLVGMLLKFGFLSASIARIGFEISNVVHKNAYLVSHYAFPQYIRDQSVEFLEGIVRPMGTVIAMLFLLGLEMFFSGKDLSMWIHIGMFGVMACILASTLRLQNKYTTVSKQQLFSPLPYPEKINAIEVLAQRGHDNASLILVQKLADSANEPPLVRIKLLSVLGKMRDYESLPDILDSLSDPDIEVRLEAAHALMHFGDVGEKFYAQAFSRFRMVESLKDLFRREKSSAVRSAIIRVFSLLRERDIVAFLLEQLRDPSPEVRASSIYTLGLFRDPVAGYYIVPTLEDADPMVRANACIALWQFPKYRPRLEKVIAAMVRSDQIEEIKGGVFAIGEIGLPRRNLLLSVLKYSPEELGLEVAFALTKCADEHGFEMLLTHILSLPQDEFERVRRFLYRLKPEAKQMVEHMVIDAISAELNKLMKKSGSVSLEEIDPLVLERLRRLYKVIDQHEELYAIESALAKQHMRPVPESL